MVVREVVSLNEEKSGHVTEVDSFRGAKFNGERMVILRRCPI